MMIENPHTKKLQDAIRSGNEKKREEVELKWRAFNKEILDKIYAGLPVVESKVEDLEERKEKIPGLRKAYKEACDVYREIDDLKKRIRFVKKEFRERLKGYQKK